MTRRPDRAPRARRLLLDTHALLWWMLGDAKLPAFARELIAAEDTTIFVSAASIWEMVTKHRLGRLPLPAEASVDLLAAVRGEGFELLAIEADHAQSAGRLRGAVGDPFDRMLIAQAMEERLVLISNERPFDAYGITRLWSRPR
jgi:PIN domain nuclease of toxin-antitoxin system